MRRLGTQRHLQKRCVFPKTSVPDPGQPIAQKAHETSRVRGWAGRFTRQITNLPGIVITVLAPSLCRICDLPLDQAKRYPVCAPCLAEAVEADLSPLCTCCGESLGMESARAAQISQFPVDLCPACAEDRPPFVSARAVGAYRGTLRELIHLLKYEFVQPVAKPLGRSLAEIVAAGLPLQPCTVTLVAVPLFRGKRSFNQSALLADAALPWLRQSCPGSRFETRHELLKRTRSTRSHFSLSAQQRRKNVRGAFTAEDVQGRHVVLVDDIYTTGATAIECTRVLLAAGAGSVRIATLARAQQETAIRWLPLQASSGHLVSAGIPASPLERQLRQEP